MRFVIASAALIALVPVAAVAQDTAPEAPAKEKKICKRDVSTGSRLGRRICKTKAEWDAVERADREDRGIRDARNTGD